MNTKNIFIAGSISVVFIVSSACNLIRLMNPVDEVVSEIETLTTQIPIEEIEENLEALATEIPSDFGDIGDLGGLTELAGTMEAYQDGFATGEAPPDIPVIAENENFLGSRDLVSYQTPLKFPAVLDFYQHEMVVNGWQFQTDDSVITDQAAVLRFAKPNREALLTLGYNEANNNTVVLITIELK